MITDNSNVVQYVKTGKSLRETLLALDRLLTAK